MQPRDPIVPVEQEVGRRRASDGGGRRAGGEGEELLPALGVREQEKRLARPLSLLDASLQVRYELGGGRVRGHAVHYPREDRGRRSPEDPCHRSSL